MSDIGGSEQKKKHKSDRCNNLTEISARFVMAQRSRRDLSETDLKCRREISDEITEISLR